VRGVGTCIPVDWGLAFSTGYKIAHLHESFHELSAVVSS
jgi:hypothetical protein